MVDQGFGTFPGVLVSKTIFLEGTNKAKKVQLSKAGRGDNNTLQVYVSTSADESSWSNWQEVTFGTIVTITSQAKYLRVMVAAVESSVFRSKDAQGNNVGVEIDVLEVA